MEQLEKPNWPEPLAWQEQPQGLPLATGKHCQCFRKQVQKYALHHMKPHSSPKTSSITKNLIHHQKTDWLTDKFMISNEKVKTNDDKTATLGVLPQTEQDTRLWSHAGCSGCSGCSDEKQLFFSAEAQNHFKGKGDSPPNHAPFAQCRVMLEIFTRHGYWAVPR